MKITQILKTSTRLMKRSVLALAAFAGLMTGNVNAATNTWQNGGNLFWTNTANWAATSLPGTADTAIFAGANLGAVDLSTTTQTISVLSISAVGYTFTNGTLSLNIISNTFPNGTAPVIAASVTDQNSDGLTIKHSNGDCTGFTMNGPITIGNTGPTALQVAWISSQRTGSYTLGSTSLTNSVAGGISLNVRLNGGVTFQGPWTIGGNMQMINGSSDDNNGRTFLKGAITISGNLMSVPTGGNSSTPCGFEIVSGSDVRVSGNMLMQAPSTFAPSIRIYQPMRLGGSINVYDGSLWLGVTNPFLNLGTGLADTSKVITLGAPANNQSATIAITATAKTNNNPITVQSGSSGAAILASGATGTGAGNKVTFNGPVTLNKNLTVNANNTGNAILDVTGKISGAQGLFVNNGTFAGTVWLSNTGNDYTGGTSVNNGILQYNNGVGTIAGSGRNVTVNAPGTVALGYVPAVSIQNDLLSRITSPSTGALGLTASTSENFDFSGSGNGLTALSLGAFGTATYTGTLTPYGTTYRLGGGGGTLTFTPATYTSGNDLVINGNGLTGTVNLGGLSKTFGAITLAGGTVQNGTLTGTSFNLQSATVSATLIGTGVNLVKTGTGTLTFNSTAVQPFTGELIINAGTLTEDFANLTATPNDNLINSGTVLTLGGGTLILKGKNNVASSQTFASTTLSAGAGSAVTVSYTGSGTMTAGLATLTRNAGSTLLVNGANLGKDTASIASVSRLFFAAAPTLVGTTAALGTGINSAVKNTQIVPFLLGTATAATGGLGTTGNANTFLTYAAGTGLRPLNPTDEFDNNPASFTAGNNVRITAANTYNPSSSLAINALVLETGNDVSFKIQDGKTLTITSGAVLFSNGNTQINPTTSTGAIDFGTAEAVVTVANAGRFFVTTAGSGGLTKSGNGSLALSGTHNFSGAGITTINAGTLELGTTGFLTPGGTLVNNGTLYFGGGTQIQGVNFPSNMTGIGTLKMNSGTVVLRGSNAYTGGTILGVVNNDGKCSFDNDGAFGSGPISYIGNTTYLSSADATPHTLANTLNITGGGNTFRLGWISAPSYLGSGAITFTGPVNLSANVVAPLDIVNTTTFSGIVSGAGGGITKTSGGTLVLSNTNTFSGATTVSAGTLTLNNNLALQNSRLATSANTINLGSGVTAPTLGGLTGSVALSMVFTSGGYTNVTALTLNPQSGTTPSYSGAISDGVSSGMTLTKSGLGTQTLTGTNTYSGGTTISAGTLAVSGTLGSGDVTVAAGGTLSLSTSSAISDSKRLMLVSGAGVTIAATYNETVNELYINGELQKSGTWGTSSSSPTPANIDNVRFAGTGILTVLKGKPAGTMIRFL